MNSYYIWRTSPPFLKISPPSIYRYILSSSFHSIALGCYFLFLSNQVKRDKCHFEREEEELKNIKMFHLNKLFGFSNRKFLKELSLKAQKAFNNYIIIYRIHKKNITLNKFILKSLITWILEILCHVFHRS